MCLLNYNRKSNKYKHISVIERTMIERWYNKEKRSKKEIADLLGKSERTIRREIKRGKIIVKGYQWEDKEEYSSRVSQKKYEYNIKAKGQEIKIGKDYELVKRIETEIKREKKSPEVIVKELGINISARTIRNYIKSGDIFEIRSKDMIYDKQYKNKNKEKRVSKMVPAEKSIEYRPQEANERSEYGHWEGDLIIGKKKTKTVLFTLTERMTREEIIVKLKSKHAQEVAKALNNMERKLQRRFYNKFKTITFDNGVEFQNYEVIEKSCLRKRKRFNIYYAHPYCSGERGSNENANRMIRRWIPKGTDINKISNEYINKIEEWMNNYLRKMFGYKSSNMLLLEI